MTDSIEDAKKPEPLWSARSKGHYCVECYDFQLCKKSDPPDIGSDPIILPMKKAP